MNTIKFLGNGIVPQFMKSDKSFRICIDISRDQIEAVQDIILQRIKEDKNYIITIEESEL